MTHRKRLLLGLILTAPTLLLVAQEGETEAIATQAAIVTAAEMQWREGPPTLPAGAQMAVLDGDPRKEGPFTIRLKMPAGYKIPPHTHPTAERVTVISGAVQLGIGRKFEDNAGRELKAGDFAVVPPRVPHFAAALSDAVLQIHSEGPFERTFIEPGVQSPTK